MSLSAGTSVAASARPDDGASFTGWSGACSGTGPCSFTLTVAATLTAHFEWPAPPPSPPPPPPPAPPPPTPPPAPPPAPPPPVIRTLTVALSGDGAGEVASDPAGVTCGSACRAEFPDGTKVRLTPTAAAGSTFTGWTGACTGAAACELTLTADASVGAAFALVPRKPYALVEVPSPDPDGYVIPYAMNVHGDVVGAYATPRLTARAFIARGGGPLELIGPLDRWTQALAVNDAGVVAVAEQDFRKVARWTPGRYEVLEDAPGTLGSYATAIGPDGTIVGRAWLAAGAAAFAAPAGKVVLLPALPGAMFCAANALNAAGVVVGGCDSTAVSWKVSGPVALPVEPSANARGVNDAGMVCGTARGAYKHLEGFVLDSWTGEVRYQTPTAPHFAVALAAIDPAGVAVGQAMLLTSWSDAILVRAGEVQYLKDLVDPLPVDWPIESAIAINARGEVLVTGHAYVGGRIHAAVLHPR
ncbi:MAG: hypothetical protein QM704_12540 [Anaeromyxobacteraceae bacterium]